MNAWIDRNEAQRLGISETTREAINASHNRNLMFVAFGPRSKERVEFVEETASDIAVEIAIGASILRNYNFFA